MRKQQKILSNAEIIRYFDINQANEKTLVLIHGNFSGAQFFDTLMSKLPKNLRVIAPDLRGFGDSSYYKRIHSLKELAADVIELLSLLEITSYDVLGWSLGGGVAMEMAARDKHLHKLILVASTTHKGYPVYKKDANGKTLDGQTYDSPEQMAFDPIQVAPVLYTLKNQYYDGIKYLYDTLIFTNKKPSKDEEKRWYETSLKQRNLIDADWALANQNMSHEQTHYQKGENTIKDIQNQTLHIWGKDDKTTPESMILENIKGIQNSTSVYYEQCGHAPFVDQEEKFMNDLLTFIER